MKDTIIGVLALLTVSGIIFAGLRYLRNTSDEEYYEPEYHPPAEDYDYGEDDTELLPAPPAETLTQALLLNAQARTAALSELRTDCPECGYDHIGECIPREQHAAAGEVTLTRHLGHAPGTDGWEWAVGTWHPPLAVLQRLEEEAANDWLAQLLRTPHQVAHLVNA
jgi:hypothetical protein